RRSTMDWVLQRAVAAEPGLTLRFGVRATGLRARSGQPPRVVGLRTDRGDVDADLVVDASGRRSPIDRWLGEIGARPAADWQAGRPGAGRRGGGGPSAPRHSRVRPGAALPGLLTTRIVVGLDEFTVGLWGCDNGAMQMTVAPLAADRRFRTLVRPEVLTAVLR